LSKDIEVVRKCNNILQKRKPGAALHDGLSGEEPEAAGCGAVRGDADRPVMQLSTSGAVMPASTADWHS